jgi:transketolase
MRAALIETLMELAERDPKVFLLTADLGFSVVERFASRYPTRFLNVGVAEANMIGIATGLATRQYTPYCYSMSTFTTMRAYEQIRDGPVLHGLPVRLIGIGGGFAYGHAGITHFGLEDYAVGRAQPRLAVVSPCDPPQTSAAVRAMHAHPGPVYFRIGKGGDPVIPELGGRFRPGELEVMSEGSAALLLSTGSISVEMIAAARLLASQGFPCTTAAVPCLSPFRARALVDLMKPHRLVATVEEHYTTGGLGSLVAEIIADHGLAHRLHRIGVSGMPTGVSGSQAFHRRRSGLNREAIAATLADLLRS